MPAAAGAGIDQERRLAAHAPAALVGRIEGDAGNGLVVIDAVRLANGDAAVNRVRPGDQLFGVAERSPLAVAVIVGDAALDGPENGLSRPQAALAAVAQPPKLEEPEEDDGKGDRRHRCCQHQP